jgi:hypothetical protein
VKRRLTNKSTKHSQGPATHIKASAAAAHDHAHADSAVPCTIPHLGILQCLDNHPSIRTVDLDALDPCGNVPPARRRVKLFKDTWLQPRQAPIRHCNEGAAASAPPEDLTWHSAQIQKQTLAYRKRLGPCHLLGSLPAAGNFKATPSERYRPEVTLASAVATGFLNSQSHIHANHSPRSTGGSRMARRSSHEQHKLSRNPFLNEQEAGRESWGDVLDKVAALEKGIQYEEQVRCLEHSLLRLIERQAAAADRLEAAEATWSKWEQQAKQQLTELQAATAKARGMVESQAALQMELTKQALLTDNLQASELNLREVASTGLKAVCTNVQEDVKCVQRAHGLEAVILREVPLHQVVLAELEVLCHSFAERLEKQLSRGDGEAAQPPLKCCAGGSTGASSGDKKCFSPPKNSQAGAGQSLSGSIGFFARLARLHGEPTLQNCNPSKPLPSSCSHAVEGIVQLGLECKTRCAAAQYAAEPEPVTDGGTKAEHHAQPPIASQTHATPTTQCQGARDTPNVYNTPVNFVNGKHIRRASPLCASPNGVRPAPLEHGVASADTLGFGMACAGWDLDPECTLDDVVARMGQGSGSLLAPTVHSKVFQHQRGARTLVLMLRTFNSCM